MEVKTFNYNEIIQNDKLLYLGFHSLLSSIPLEFRANLFKSLDKSFVGFEAPAFVISKSMEMQQRLFERIGKSIELHQTFFIIRNREEAINIIRLWMKAGLIQSSSGIPEFLDNDSSFYIFTPKASKVLKDISDNVFYSKVYGSSDKSSIENSTLSALAYLQDSESKAEYSELDLDSIVQRMFHSIFNLQITKVRKSSLSSLASNDISSELGQRRRISAASTVNSIQSDGVEEEEQDEDIETLNVRSLRRKIVSGMRCVTWLLLNTSLRNREVAAKFLSDLHRKSYFTFRKEVNVDLEPTDNFTLYDDKKLQLYLKKRSKHLLHPQVSIQIPSIDDVYEEKQDNYVISSSKLKKTRKESLSVSIVIVPEDSNLTNFAMDISSIISIGERSIYSNDDCDKSLPSDSFSRIIKKSPKVWKSTASTDNETASGPVLELGQKKHNPYHRLNTILQYPLLLKHFEEFMKRQYREENLSFLIEVGNFKRKFCDFEQDPTMENEMILEANRIYHLYLVPGSTNELNLHEKTVKNCKKFFEKDESSNHDSINVNVFDEIETSITKMIALECTYDFINSEEYQNALAEENSHTKEGALGRRRGSWFNWADTRKLSSTSNVTSDESNQDNKFDNQQKSFSVQTLLPIQQRNRS